MRVVTLLVTLIVTSSVGIVLFNARPAKPKSSEQANTYFTDITATRNHALLDEFIASLDPTIMKDCVAQFEAGKPIDLDHLAKCGDFDTYAHYMRISKFEAVKKFKYVMLHSSSKLEFEDRLAR